MSEESTQPAVPPDAAAPHPAATPPPVPAPGEFMEGAGATHPRRGVVTRLSAQPRPWQLVDAVLRHPVALAEYAGRGGAQLRRLALLLLVTSAFSLAVFGFLVGNFSGHEQLWAAPLKLLIVGFGSALLCLPSLYIFAALAGRELDLRGASGSMLAILARAALLLLGFSPLAWLFAASVTSIVFYGVVILVLGILSTLVGLGFFTARRGGGANGYLVLWAAVFLLVTLQMPTSLRPIIGRADSFLPAEKRFFLAHWGEMFEAGVRANRAASRKPEAENPPPSRPARDPRRPASPAADGAGPATVPSASPTPSTSLPPTPAAVPPSGVGSAAGSALWRRPAVPGGSPQNGE